MTGNRLKTRFTGLAIAAAATMSLSVHAATSVQINQAIDDGLAYLAGSQLGNGSWSYGGYEQAATGAAAFAMLSQQSQWNAPVAAGYQAKVDNAIGYLLSSASVADVSTRYNDTAPGGPVNICPGGSATCKAVYWDGAGEATYTTGLIAPAIALYAKNNPNAVATATGPLANMTWAQIAQGITNTFAAAQATQAYGYAWGGWRYGLPQNTDADSSTTQWGAIAMLYNQTLGAVTPSVTKNDLKEGWLKAGVQTPGYGGAACYQPGSGLCDHSDTGGMLVALSFVGEPLSDARVQSALTFLKNNWTQTPNGDTWSGNFGHPYAMWSVYKGLESTIGLNDTTNIPLGAGDCGVLDAGTACNWWQDYNDYLVSSQNTAGGWDGYSAWWGPLATAFYLPILGGTDIPNGGQTPEPVSLALVGLALVGLGAVRRRRAA